MEILPPECGVEKQDSAVEKFLVMVAQLVAEGLSTALLQEVKSSEKLWHDTPLISLCSSGRPDFGSHIKNCRRHRHKIFCVR